jgi:hypothetical protein
MSLIAYEISPNLKHIPKRPKGGEVEKYDAELYPSGSINNWTLVDSSPYTGPEPLNFLGWPKRLPKTEFPRNFPGFPLMSKRMLEVLCSVGEFPHRAIATRVFDYDLEREIEQYSHCGDLEPELCNENYVAVHLLKHIDGADLERSTFRTDIAVDPPLINNLILKEPVEGFPPLFRIKRKPIYLFVSPEAKRALEQAGIKSIDYFAWDKNGVAGWVYKLRDGTEHIGNNPLPPKDLVL